MTENTVRHHIIVGVDYGTTYSGVSLILSSKKNIGDIIQCETWTGNTGSGGTVTALKAPSRIAYASQNPSLREDQWGYGIDPGVSQCSWMKLLLDKNAMTKVFDDPDLKGDIERGRIALPPGKTAESVTGDYLKHLYNHIMRTLEGKLGGAVLDVTDIRFWLTKPAIWTDEAETQTLNAARQAGFGSRSSVKDEICLILEPEAAALATISSLARDRSAAPKIGDSVVICDCGGGTVDLTSYIIEALKPKLSLRESYNATGGKCGGTSVDRQLRNWMQKKYGSYWDQVDEKFKGPGSKFMNVFERNKKTFGTGGHLSPMPLPMDYESEDGDPYDEEDGVLNLDNAIMKELFDPVIKIIKALIQKQIDGAKNATKKPVNKLLLVGGFGDSAYLKKELESHLLPQKITVHVPHKSTWGAVSKGAVLRGLETATVDLRKSRRSYGLVISIDYQEGIHNASEKYTDEFGRVLVPNYMSWAIKKGTEINEKTRIKIPLERVYYLNTSREIRTNLCCCDDDVAPERNVASVKEVGCIVANLSSVDFRPFKKTQTSWGEAVNLEFEIVIILGGKQGTVYFQFCIGGNTVGTAEIEFTKST